MKTNYLLVLFALLLAIPQAADAKKKKDIAIQLYSVRDIINNGTDLNVVLKNLAQMGYTSIEAANYDNGKFYGKTPEEFKNAVEKGWYESTVFTLFQRIVGQGSGFRRFLRVTEMVGSKHCRS